jgi:hypothetical protein
MLRIRRFTFRGHSVVWLAGSVGDLTRLRDAITTRAHGAAQAVSLDGLVPLDNPDGIVLCAVFGDATPAEEGVLHWACLGSPGIEEVARRLGRIVEGRSIEETFALLPMPAELLVERAPDEPH